MLKYIVNFSKKFFLHPSCPKHRELELLWNEYYILGLDSPHPWALAWLLAWDVFGHSPVLTLLYTSHHPVLPGSQALVVSDRSLAWRTPRLQLCTSLSVGVFSGQSYEWMNESLIPLWVGRHVCMCMWWATSSELPSSSAGTGSHWPGAHTVD